MNPHFASIVLGLTAQADAALSGQLPPGSEKMPGTNPRQIAQALIDTLAMLEIKTKGNLEPDEAKLLAEALTGLRFRFVQGGGGTN